MQGLGPNARILITSANSVLSFGRRVLACRAVAKGLTPMDTTRIDQFIQEHDVVTLPAASLPVAVAGSPPPALSSEACALKCLVFLAENSPILVILRMEDRVSEQALARYLGLAKSRISMAPPDQLVDLTGYPVGEVPPFAHRNPLRTIVDQLVMSHTQVAFGHHLQYVLLSSELVRAAHAQVAAVSTDAADVATARAVYNERTIYDSSSFPPGRDGDILSKNLPVPWVQGTEIVTMSGIIAQKRKIANLLLFLNIVPPSSGALARPGTAAYLRRRWAHPDTGGACEVQLILGKTLERRLGRGAAADLFKALKVGQVVKLTGRPQPHVQPADGQSRAHVVDLVVQEIEITGQAQIVYEAGQEDEEEESEEEEESSGEDDEGGAPRDKASRAFTPAVAAALAADVPYYTLNIPAENVKVVDDLAGIEFMSEILLAHHRKEAENNNNSGGTAEYKEESFDGTADTTVPPGSVFSTSSNILESGVGIEPPAGTTAVAAAAALSPTLLSGGGGGARARAKAAKRQAALDPGAWRPSLVIGMDCEWQPTTKEEPMTPVSVLQIGSKTHVFLVDMLAICFNARNTQSEGADIPLTPEQQALSSVLEAILGDKDIIKVGFGLRYDFKRLAESYPWMPCFGAAQQAQQADCEGPTESAPQPPAAIETIPVRSVPIQSHVDALVLARSAGDGRMAYKRLGLAAVCRIVLGQALDKSEQTSSWEVRPLSENQLNYAAIDVACLVDIFENIINKRPEFLATYWMTLFSGNLTDIAPLRPKYLFTRRPAGYVGSAESAAPGAAVPWRAQVTGRGVGPTSQVACNIDALIQYLGKPIPEGGKLAVVRMAAAESLPGGGVIEPEKMPRFPRGSGVLEFSNSTFMLFINVPSHRYPNVFSLIQGDAKEESTIQEENSSEVQMVMTWWPGKGHTLAHPVIRRLLPAAAAAMATGAMQSSVASIGAEVAAQSTLSSETPAEVPDAPTVLLFARPQKAEYVCCGRLEVASVDEIDGQLCVSWRLVDYATIKESAYFQQVLNLQKGGNPVAILKSQEQNTAE